MLTIRTLVSTVARRATGPTIAGRHEGLVAKEKAKVATAKEARKARKAKEKAEKDQNTRTRPSPKRRIEAMAVAMRMPFTLQRRHPFCM